MYILSTFTTNGLPATGLSPTIRIRNVTDNALVVTDAAMSEVGDGWYKYNYVGYDPSLNYAIRCDGGVAQPVGERYTFSGSDNTEAVWSIATRTLTAFGFTVNTASDSAVTAIKTKTDNLPSDPASNTQVATRLAASAYTVPDNAAIALIKTKTDLIPANPAAVGSAMTLTSAYDAAKTAAPSVEEIWQRVIDAGLTSEELLRLMSAVLVGKVSGAGTPTITFRAIDDSKARVTASVDPQGNRLAVTTDVS